MSRPSVDRRRRRVGDLIRQEISRLLLRGLKDSRIDPMTSVTDVKVSSDLKYANVRISVMGGAKAERSTLIALQHAAGYIQAELAKVLALRFTPKLRFTADDRIREGDRVLGLMQQLHDGKVEGTLEAEAKEAGDDGDD